jgi:hypothetical protein
MTLLNSQTELMSEFSSLLNLADATKPVVEKCSKATLRKLQDDTLARQAFTEIC